MESPTEPGRRSLPGGLNNTKTLSSLKRNGPREGAKLLGYLDSNQEQMIAISAVPLPRTWGGIPRISADFMGLVYALARTDTGSFWSRSGVSGSFLVTE